MIMSKAIESMKKHREHTTLKDAALNPLWRMEMMGHIGIVIAQWSMRLTEFEIKHPEKDVSDRREEIEYLQEVENWMRNLWDRTIQEYRLNTHVTLQSLKLLNEIKEKDKYIKQMENELSEVKENIKNLELK